ncbi:MAG: N-acetyl-gamma-glutamyl-phosphate reductase [Pontixanthobacter sp.]
MTFKLFIDGAAGTTGLEIRERLSQRPEFEMAILPDDRRKDAEARRDALNGCDVAILCLPDEAARDAVASIENDTTRVIDASTAHRVADGWTYGCPELVGERSIAKASRIANPGCYPTGFLALIAPLIADDILPRDWPYTVHAVSGYSGGGNALIDRFDTDRTIGWRGYGLAMGHKHLNEMQHYADLTYPPVFAPAVVDAHRGMVVEVPLNLAAMGKDTRASDIHRTLHEFYASSPIVTIAPMDLMPDELLLRTDATPWDGMILHVFADDESGHVRLIARLDNLGKGASGAVVQSLNLIAGLPQETGLNLDAR